MTKYTVKVEVEVEAKSRVEAIMTVSSHLGQPLSSPLHFMPIDATDVKVTQ